MDVFRTRIRHVRLKSGGSLRLLDNPREAHHREMVGALARVATEYDDELVDKLAGFALVAFTADGQAISYIRGTASCPYDWNLYPELARQALSNFVSKIHASRVAGRNDFDDGA